MRKVVLFMHDGKSGWFLSKTSKNQNLQKRQRVTLLPTGKITNSFTY